MAPRNPGADEPRPDGGVVADDLAGGQYLRYDRPAFTKWHVEVRTYPGALGSGEVDAVFRTGFRDNRECEIFTLLPAGREFALVQVELCGSRTRTYAYVPTEIAVNPSQKLVMIRLLCTVEFTAEGLIQIGSLPE